jgi:hypothetical protein
MCHSWAERNENKDNSQVLIQPCQEEETYASIIIKRSALQVTETNAFS